MLCRRCSETAPAALPQRRDASTGGVGVGVATGVWCARCGAALGPQNLTERLFAKLAQLARFGLAAGDAVLRRPASPEER